MGGLLTGNVKYYFEKLIAKFFSIGDHIKVYMFEIISTLKNNNTHYENTKVTQIFVNS